jgi:hypothetical protein
MGLPIPPPDPQALQRMKNDQLWAEQHHQSALIKVPMAMIKGSPDVSGSAHQGPPQMNPPNDAISATDILKPGARGPSFTIAGTNGDASATDQPSDAAPVDAATKPAGAPDPGLSMGIQIISQPNDPNAAAAASPASADPAPAANDASLKPSGNVPVLAPTPNLPTPDNSVPVAAPPPPNEAASTTSSAPRTESSSTAPQGAGTPATGAPTTAQAQGAQPKAADADPKQESSSKKKKGIKKLIPW